MANIYRELKKRHQEEYNDFPKAFAFNEYQLEKGLEKLGLKPNETCLVTSIGAGGFIRKSDASDYVQLVKKHTEEMKAAIEQDETGDGFIFHMFVYELANHEYPYSDDLEPTLDALGLSYDDISENEKLEHGLKKARQVLEEAYQ